MFRPLFFDDKNKKYVISNEPHYKFCGYQYTFNGNQSSWTIPHGMNSTDFVIEIVIDNIVQKIYDLQIVDENLLIINFGVPTNGFVNLLFKTENEICVQPVAVTPTPTPTITPSILPL